MPSPIQWFLRKAVEAAPKLVFQVTVSVVATLCAAYLTNSLLKTGSTRQPAAQAVEADAAPDVDAATVDTGIRVRVNYPVEFAAFYGPALDRPHVSPLGDVPAALAGDGTHKPKINAEKKAVHACSADCGRKPVAAALPPARPAEITQVAQAAPALTEAPAEPKPLHLLGVPLPGFVPSGEKIVNTVVSLGDTVTGIIPGL